VNELQKKGPSALRQTPSLTEHDDASWVLRRFPTREKSSGGLVELKLTKEQAEELDGLLDGYLKHLGYEITATDNPEYREKLKVRRIHLAEAADTLGRLLRGGPAQSAS
jgi:hypothetical protein